ncbi:MAG: hypothetical protein QHI38_03920 [Armatimonadota bacterium]|nr:hypothetical protein [Armatimonadota bacterium]
MPQFAYKPNFEDALRHWHAFWAQEIIDRPCAKIVVSATGRKDLQPLSGVQYPGEDLATYIRAFDEWAADTYFAADAVPFFVPNFGPDVYAAFFGAELKFAKDHATSWAVPFVTDWENVAELFSSPKGRWWDAALDFVSKAREIGRGKFGVGVFDLHSNLDCLAAMRGPEQLCMDLLDCPDAVEEALVCVRRTYPLVFEALYEASGQNETGCTTWLPMYYPGKFAVVQCDFICMISPEHFRRFVMPALEEEAAYLGHSCFHLDGPEALVHLEDILSIKEIQAIQWVPGAGNAPLIQWMDLLKRIQDAGKSVYVGCTAEELPVYHRELAPNKVFYDVHGVASAKDADNLIRWLIENT